MNRSKFLKLLGGLLVALPFMKKWFVSEQPSELSNRVDNADIISYDTFADDRYIVFFNMTAEEIAETKAEWQEQLTKTIVLSSGFDAESRVSYMPGLDQVINTGRQRE